MSRRASGPARRSCRRPAHYDTVFHELRNVVVSGRPFKGIFSINQSWFYKTYSDERLSLIHRRFRATSSIQLSSPATRVEAPMEEWSCHTISAIREFTGMPRDRRLINLTATEDGPGTAAVFRCRRSPSRPACAMRIEFSLPSLSRGSEPSARTSVRSGGVLAVSPISQPIRSFMPHFATNIVAGQGLSCRPSAVWRG